MSFKLGWSFNQLVNPHYFEERRASRTSCSVGKGVAYGIYKPLLAQGSNQVRGELVKSVRCRCLPGEDSLASKFLKDRAPFCNQTVSAWEKTRIGRGRRFIPPSKRGLKNVVKRVAGRQTRSDIWPEQNPSERKYHDITMLTRNDTAIRDHL